MDTATFRFATPQDTDIILDFIRRLGDYEHLSEQVIATEALLQEWIFGKRKAEVLFAMNGEREVGFALFFHNFSTFLGRAGIYLEDLFVMEEYRGRGYGKALLCQLARIAQERGCGRLEWSCLDWNRPSIDFYLSMGALPMSDWTVYRVSGEALHTLAQSGQPQIGMPAGNRCSLLIRPMTDADAAPMNEGFLAQGWQSREETFIRYLDEQAAGRRRVLIAVDEGAPVGYITLLPAALTGPFAGSGLPELSDFNVLISHQRRGIGTALMNTAEQLARTYGNRVTLAVGLHNGYGAAQRLYVRRGYVPDGSGVWYRDRIAQPYGEVNNDDGLLLYMSKDL